MGATRFASPFGVPRLTQCRNASNSDSVWGSFIKSIQFAGLFRRRWENVYVHRISFIDALRRLQTVEPGDELTTLVVNPDRPSRVEPRVLKRRPKEFLWMKKPRRQRKQELENK